MCATDLAPDLDITEQEHRTQEHGTHEHRTGEKHPGVAWGCLAGRYDGQDDLDGQDVAKPRA